ncbi:MAG: hypothetical protein AB1750_19495 [Chloroflexota bacterium]
MNKTSASKSLSHGDESAADFVIEMLAGDVTYGINLDRIQWDNKYNCYVIIEYLLCDESQFDRGVTPFTSHPNRYFHKNAQKFISLWELAKTLQAKLLLVNYSKKGTKHENEVLLMRVDNVDANQSEPVKTTDKKLTRAEYSAWFRQMNKRGMR